jgi:Zn-finger nucleic acid-binding protein
MGCGRCGGVWLDNDASRAVVEGAAQALAQLADVASTKAKERVDTGAGGLLCPACGQALARTVAPGTAVELDMCADHGTWFDAGELRIVALAYARLPPPLRFAVDDYEAREDEGPSFPTNDGRWMLGSDGRWKFKVDPTKIAALDDDRHQVTLDEGGAFVEGLLTFVRGVVHGLRR